MSEAGSIELTFSDAELLGLALKTPKCRAMYNSSLVDLECFPALDCGTMATPALGIEFVVIHRCDGLHCAPANRTGTSTMLLCTLFAIEEPCGCRNLEPYSILKMHDSTSSPNGVTLLNSLALGLIWSSGFLVSGDSSPTIASQRLGRH